MLFKPALVILSFVISVGNCQFFYNYEEADETALNPPSTVNQQMRQGNVAPTVEVTEEHRSPRVEITEEHRSPRTEEERSPRRRQYRRILREGTYVQPPTTQAPNIYGPSIFENIELGQAPNGVYIPQDSFLNVLRNPSRKTEVSHPYSINYASPISYQNNARTFYVAPEEQIRPESAIPSVVEPNVQSSAYNINSEEEESRRTRPNRRQRQQQARKVEPVVDIDVLRTPPDVMRDMTPIPVQTRPSNQGRSVSSNGQGQTSRVQYYSDPIQPPRVYSPSVFENIGLGEAPNGVDIPADSLLNILKNPLSHSSPRAILDNSQNAVQPHETTDQDQFETKVMTPASRRPLRQRSGNSNIRRRTEYQYDDETKDPIQSVPASSQPQRRQRNRNNDPAPRYATTLPENRPSRRQQQVSAEYQQPKDTSREQQRKFKAAKLAIAALPEDTDEDGIPGEAGVDYPTLHTIPRTVFSCREQPHNGYYADLETSCQVVHLCQARGVQNSFLCPNGTIFSQEKFSCQWWFKVNCADSPKFYSINDNLYKIPENKQPKRS